MYLSPSSVISVDVFSAGDKPVWLCILFVQSSVSKFGLGFLCSCYFLEILKLHTKFYFSLVFLHNRVHKLSHKHYLMIEILFILLGLIQMNVREVILMEISTMSVGTTN